MRFLPAVLLVAACAPTLPPAPRVPEADPAFAAAAEPPKPGIVEAAAQNEDVLCAGDVIAVRTISAVDVSAPVGQAVDPHATSVDEVRATVDRAGKLHLALVGDVSVEGLSIQQAELRVQEMVLRYDRFSRVALSILESRGHFATVTGAVEHPGSVPLVGDAHFADVLANAGGTRVAMFEGQFVTHGDLDAARIIRGGEVLPVDARLGMSGDPRHNIRIRPKDVIVVPAALDGRVAVIGHVARPHTMQFRRGYRLTEAIADAGGLAKEADSEDIRVLRGGLSHPRVFVANAKDILAGVRSDVALAPGDVVFVTEHWTATIGAILDRGIPLLSGAFYAQAITR